MSSEPTPAPAPAFASGRSPADAEAEAAHDRDETEFFSLAVVAELAGVNTRTVLHYQEQGFIRPLRPRTTLAGDDSGSSLPAETKTEKATGTGTDTATSGDACSGESTTVFDTECLRQLRRIEHLRETCGVNDTGLRLILNLLQEVEQLRQLRRQARL